MRRASRVIELGGPEAVEAAVASVEEWLARKEPGDVDATVVQDLKRIIRESEASAAIEALGLSKDRARFLDLPFLPHRQGPEEPDLGGGRGDRHGPSGGGASVDGLRRRRPLRSPRHHRMCLEAVERALARYSGDPPLLWYYRGAWVEWGISEATVLVPLSEHEMRAKVQAIFRHESQKDSAPFPGADPREFWQRVVDRNRRTADLLASLGLPAYRAMEAYVTMRGGRRVEAQEIPTALLGEEGG